MKFKSLVKMLGFFIYNAAMFLLKKSLNFFLVSKLSINLNTIFCSSSSSSSISFTFSNRVLSSIEISSGTSFLLLIISDFKKH